MHTQQGAPQWAETTAIPSQPETVGKKNNPWIYGVVGLVVGAALGLTIGFSASGAEDKAAAQATAEAITAAVETCSLSGSEGITVLDGGSSIEMQTVSQKTWQGGASFSDVTCVLDALQTPQSIQARMETTRALDGRQTGTWPGFSISWGFHPDNGLNVIVETQEQP